MPEITTTSQLSTFSIIKGILQKSSLLSIKFKDSDYYEFEPKRLGVQYNQLPYIVIEIPSEGDGPVVLDHSTRLVDFVGEIRLVMDWESRDNMSKYASEILATVRQHKATLENSGYHNVKIDFDGGDSEIQDMKNIVVGTFTISYDGYTE